MIIYFFIFSSGEISHQQQRRGREFNTEEGDVGEVSPQALQKCLAAAARRGVYTAELFQDITSWVNIDWNQARFK